MVRSAQRPDSLGGLSFLVQLGLQRSQDDSFIVEDFMLSRDAVRDLQKHLPLRDMFRTDPLDFIAGYPSLLYGLREERFYKYFQTMVSVVHTDKTGISTLKVRAFSAENAKKIADTLLQAGEGLVNRLNERLLRDAVGRAEAEVMEAQNRVIAAQATLTAFRNKELLIDPTSNAVALAELIAKLSGELASTRAQIAEARMNASTGPQIPILERKAIALDEQIASERARVARSSDGLADRIATYERLVLEREFANKMLGTNEADLVRAKAEAAKQLLYLESIVEPNLADYSTQPKRLRSVLTVLGANLLLVLIAWLVFTGIREHGARH
ncbi:capsule biosynthesis protein [Reyranella sp.]|uniref:capsule biosynthesis protein n=1 Tax=Reyranella sp. TaxID=1929291 RepID=UPI0026008C4D|nr:capsule biosynthesis protein [Reyranella sp.]